MNWNKMACFFQWRISQEVCQWGHKSNYVFQHSKPELESASGLLRIAVCEKLHLRNGSKSITMQNVPNLPHFVNKLFCFLDSSFV
jgi:hypothetical protein